MKQSLKKLELNKKSVSNLSQKIKGGIADTIKTIDTILTTTDPTLQTMCYHCPPRRDF
ncbi:hypothetical protein [Kordia jejudonensis]|uniref:hypothetical protein n=1 Tax=Kordia jejudonensis TaxID=1348245 RepID=UPI001569079B|nr:hypothetical protein [Kordia jejudonensis]